MIHPLYLAITSLTIAANAGAALADISRAGFVLKTADEVGVARLWLPLLAALKGAGAIGLLLGLLGIPTIGTAAAAGLVAFFIGAIVAHLRARVLYNVVFPGSFLALAVMSLILSTSR